MILGPIQTGLLFGIYPWLQCELDWHVEIA